jgi:hypothetical protein
MQKKILGAQKVKVHVTQLSMTAAGTITNKADQSHTTQI